MKTLIAHREIVDRLMEGGIEFDENRLDNLYVEQVIHDARAYALRMDFQKQRRWSTSALQTYYPEYESTFQDSVCTTRFQLPMSFIQGNSGEDGLVSFGSSGDIYKYRNFYRIKSRGELGDFLNHPVMSPSSGHYVGILLEGNIVQIFSKTTIKNPCLTGVFDNPTQLPSYNKEVDMYPLSDDMADVTYDIIKKGTMYQVFSKPPDYLSNSRDNIQPQNIK